MRNLSSVHFFIESLIRLNQGYGLRVAPGFSPTVSNTNFISNTGSAAYLYYTSSNPGDPQLVNSAGTGNGVNGIRAGGIMSGTVSWGVNPDLPYVVDVLAVGSAGALDIAPGTVVKFNDSGSDLTVTGSLTALQPI